MEGPEDELDELAAKIVFEQLPEPVEKKKNTFDEARKRLIDAANCVFGSLNWNHAVLTQNVDYVDSNEGVFSVGISSVVKVELKDGTYHQEIGYGISEGLTSKIRSMSHAREDSVLRGIRSALLSFGGKMSEILMNSDFYPSETRNCDGNSQNVGITPEKKPLAQLFPNNQECTPSMSVKTTKKPSTTCTSPVLHSVNKNCMSDEESRLERKRRQQQKQEQFRQQFKQQKLIQNSSAKNTPQKTSNSIADKGNTCEWPIAIETPLAEEEFLSTQEVEQMVQTKTVPLLAVSADMRSPKRFSPLRPDSFIPKKPQQNTN
ncbi:DNA repair protein RAD52 homolog [Schistocerca piceifrons]|uniref:DNA repair protein RAD52 homolog n=1 Tax=Schistocerca piceifrons TaxID=274613 RepID=UPI001F5F4B6E|nr:DNA repair protein RAD52 homolog [Schistocerca piceifrons]